MSVDVQTEIEIRRPVEVVAGFAADPTNAPRWYANITSVEWRTQPPLTTGSVVGFVARFLGRRLVYDYEIVVHEPGSRLTMRTSEGPFPMETTYTWERRGEQTHMTLRNRGEPTGFPRVLSPLLAPMVRRANGKDLARLKQLLETEATGPDRGSATEP